MKLYIDIETYSATDLKAAGVYRYAEDPTFQILMAAWAVNDGPVRIAIGRDEISDIPGLLDPNIIKIAHNAQFERVCFSAFYHLPVGVYLDPAEWYCTQAAAAEWGYPQKLELLAKALGGEQKDEAGTRLISLFCKPNRKGERNLPEQYPEEWAAFVAYCVQDVVTLRDVDQALGPFPSDTERAVYVADQLINDNGVVIDKALAEKAVSAAEDNKLVNELEIMNLTGVANPGSVPQMMAWCEEQGFGLGNLQADTVTALLETDLTPEHRRVFELRQELALTASSKFTAALVGMSSDGRFRGGFKFFGAHTGRWAGRGLQLQNLPRAGLPEQEANAVICDLMMDMGASSVVLKQLVRALLLGPYTVVDYSAIEARVIAWLAGEAWALAAFEDGRDIYVEAANRMGGLTRAQGKIATLALGFGGGVTSMRNMGYGGKPSLGDRGVDTRYGSLPYNSGIHAEAKSGPSDYLPDREIQPLVDAWRAANRKITQLWADLGNAFGEPGRVGKHLRVSSNGSRVHIHLPSGRAIVYHDVKWERYRVVDPKTGKMVAKEGWRFRDTKGVRIGTYGGKLAENVTQAVARDLLAEALVRLHDEGYVVAGHVHDEFLVEGEHDVAKVAAIVSELPSWATGLPVSAEGFTCMRYRKG